MKKNKFLILACLLISSASFATIRVPNILGSHMVLQQNSTVKIWGWGAPEEAVTIKTNWDTITYKTQAGNGAKWQTEIKTPIAGGPYKIVINGSNEIIIDDVLIGEVWLCGGQSNMEWSGDQLLKQSIAEAPNANNNNIRFFYVPKSTALYPQENTAGHWVVCSPEEMLHFSAIGYFFGKNLTNNLHSPIGLINANWGGTPAETWTPSYIVEQSPSLLEAAKKTNNTPWWSPRVADTYNAMIAPLTNFNIAGTIWYQGESNTDTYYGYEELFTKMIGAWRSAWHKDFPFYYVQIAPFAYGRKYIGALLREAQTKALKYPNTGMVVVSDLVPDTNNIHPTLKIEVAERLANLALNKTYNFQNGITESPMLAFFKVVKEKCIVSLSNAESGLVVTKNNQSGFEIAGIDKHFMPAEFKIEGNTIILSNKLITQPVAVRYGFNNTFIPSIFNTQGLPINLFRTDNWDLDTSPIK